MLTRTLTGDKDAAVEELDELAHDDLVATCDAALTVLVVVLQSWAATDPAAPPRFAHGSDELHAATLARLRDLAALLEYADSGGEI